MRVSADGGTRATTMKKPFGWASTRGCSCPLRYPVGDISGVIRVVIVAAQRLTA
jgi:hypothetical protein